MRRLIVLAVAFVVCLSSTAQADLYGDTLIWDSGIVAYDGWESPYTTFTWSVTRDETDPGDPWTYEYTFTVPTGGRAVSHIIIEVSDGTTGGGLGAFLLTNGMDFINTQGYGSASLELQDHNPSTGPPNPYMPATIYGLKFQEVFSDPGDPIYDGAGNVVAQSWTVTFDSYRNPMWGDFYAVDGGLYEGEYPVAYNIGFGTTQGDGYNIGVPDSSYVPVPGAALLAMLGLGVTGVKLRKFA
jgi:hypothetical protein